MSAAAWRAHKIPRCCSLLGDHVLGDLAALLGAGDRDLAVGGSGDIVRSVRDLDADAGHSLDLANGLAAAADDGADVGIWDLAVSINNQRLLNEDDSGNKQKEASLIFIGEKEPHCTIDCVK